MCVWRCGRALLKATTTTTTTTIMTNCSNGRWRVCVCVAVCACAFKGHHHYHYHHHHANCSFIGGDHILHAMESSIRRWIDVISQMALLTVISVSAFFANASDSHSIIQVGRLRTYCACEPPAGNHLRLISDIPGASETLQILLVSP